LTKSGGDVVKIGKLEKGQASDGVAGDKENLGDLNKFLCCKLQSA